jgi:hypothetical protein
MLKNLCRFLFSALIYYGMFVAPGNPALAQAVTIPGTKVPIKVPDHVTMFKPVHVVFTGKNHIRNTGKSAWFDRNAFGFIRLGGKKEETILWKSLRAKDAYQIYCKFIGGNKKLKTADMWFFVSQKLFSMPDGTTVSFQAMDKAQALCQSKPELLKFIKQIREKMSVRKTEKEEGLWGLQTAKQVAETVKKLKTDSDKLLEIVGRKITPYETKFFLCYSELPLAETRKWISLLDNMYAQCCNWFGIKIGTNIWYGKCVIFIFKNKSGYTNFEVEAMKTPAMFVERSAGINHSSSSGIVRVAFYRQKDTALFAHILVHETGHGFIHRYKSPVHVPSWANEGIVEQLAAKVTGKTRKGIVPDSIFRARSKLKRDRSFEGFFEMGHIRGWQYGLAADFMQFLYNNSGRTNRFKKLVDAFKEGKKTPEALKAAYGITIEQAMTAYGRWIHVSGLTP